MYSNYRRLTLLRGHEIKDYLVYKCFVTWRRLMINVPLSRGGAIVLEAIVLSWKKDGVRDEFLP